MSPLQAKRHKIQNLQPFLNGNVPIAPIPTLRICQGLFLEIGDTSEARQTCIMCYNLHVLLSDGDTLAKN
jgi:hypothetical protein